MRGCKRGDRGQQLGTVNEGTGDSNGGIGRHFSPP